MFLIFGSSGLGLRLAKWCSTRKNCTLIGLAKDLPIGEALENCEIIALPSSMPLSDLPLTNKSPTAILYLDDKSKYEYLANLPEGEAVFTVTAEGLKD